MTERHELTIQMELHDRTLQLSYLHPSRGELHRGEVDLGRIGHEYAVRGADGAERRGLEALRWVLERGITEELVAYLAAEHQMRAGHVLMECLFGEKHAHLRPVLDDLFGRGAEPTRDAVRVRLRVADPFLEALPWRLTAYNGKRLVDSQWSNYWTFEVAGGNAPVPRVQLGAACGVLMVAPPAPRGLSDLDGDAHAEEIRSLLLGISPEYERAGDRFRVVHDVDELRRALPAMSPSILYYYGHAVVDAGQLVLRFGRGDTAMLSLADLKNAMQGRLPQIAYFNGCKTGAPGWHSAGRQLSPEVPFVAAYCTTAFTGSAQRSFKSFLTAVMDEGRDPVDALHLVSRAESTRNFEWATTIMHASYDEWRTEPPARVVRARIAAIRLDRLRQRDAVLGLVSRLVRGARGRVVALMGCAPPGNLVDQLVEHLRDYLDVNAHGIARIKIVRAKFPKERTPESFRLRLREAFRLQGDESVGSGLQGNAPALDSSNARGVVWIDWGVADALSEPPLKVADVEEWLRMARDLVGKECPEDLRVILSLGLQTAPDRLARLGAVLGELRGRPELRSTQFGVELLDTLGDVTELELSDFLYSPENTRCPPERAAEAAAAIHQRTAGKYEATVALIEEGERGSWFELLRTLKPGKSIVDSKETI